MISDEEIGRVAEDDMLVIPFRWLDTGLPKHSRPAFPFLARGRAALTGSSPRRMIREYEQL